MEELIKIYETKNGRVVSGRDLHCLLESKRDFPTWIKDKIERYGFVENQDFTSFHKIVEREKGATTRIEYAITLDMAKELSMVEGNDQGKKARRYFIECEQRLNGGAFQIPKTFSDALLLAAEQQKQIEIQQAQIAIMEPKSKAADILLLSNDNITIGEFAKSIGTGQNRLFKSMRDDKYLISQGAKENLPYQRYIDAGYFSVREVTKIANNKVKIFPQTQITPAGQVYFANRYKFK